jgi:hypothetical protein
MLAAPYHRAELSQVCPGRLLRSAGSLHVEPGTTLARRCSPCAAGYIVSSFSYLGIETIVCFTDSSETTESTAACGPGEVLFGDDSPGGPCMPPDAGSCGNGWYLFKPGCCQSPDFAYCVPAPECCGGALDCGCGNAVCEAYCNNPYGPPLSPSA